MNSLNYGAIGNCRSAALISESGSIDWCCLPDFDSPSIFTSILDPQIGGRFAFQVSDDYSIHQRYLENTNVLCTQYTSEQGSFEVNDFMPRYKTTDNDYYAPAEIYRYIRLISGNPSFKIIYDPVLNYARERVSHVIEDDKIRSYSKERPTDCVYLYTGFDLEDVIGQKEIILHQHSFLLLSYNQKLIDIDINRVYLEYQRTKVYWLNWTNRSKKFEAYNAEMMRSLLVLKIMTYQQTGSLLAALTTSIPETIGEVRNWDYRFCWLRDASMSIDTLLKMNHIHAAKRFLGFIKGILKSKDDTFQIMYGIRGERELIEFDLPHLSGYANSKPVRIGNAAYHQRQNDVFGYLLNVIYRYYKHFPGTLDEIEDMWEIVRNISRTVVTQWERPDKGIWEIRNEEKHFVSSKIMSWVAMDRASKIASLLNKTYYAESWRQVADDIREDVFKNGWNDQMQSFTQSYCNTDLDASLLLMAEYGFVENNDPRFISTVKAIEKTLYHDGLMYRYINADDFGRPTSSFTICTFWLIQALYQTGDTIHAKQLFEQLLSYSNHLGLFSEDIDFTSKRLLGNFPQAYSHLALINTAMMFAPEKKTSQFIKP